VCSSPAELEAGFASGSLHPGALLVGPASLPASSPVCSRKSNLYNATVKYPPSLGPLLRSACSQLSMPPGPIAPYQWFKQACKSVGCPCVQASNVYCCLAGAGNLKPAVAKALNRILQPVRDHFENNQEAKDLLKKVRPSSLSCISSSTNRRAVVQSASAHGDPFELRINQIGRSDRVLFRAPPAIRARAHKQPLPPAGPLVQGHQVKGRTHRMCKGPSAAQASQPL
jgi:hypothetical protein